MQLTSKRPLRLDIVQAFYENSYNFVHEGVITKMANLDHDQVDHRCVWLPARFSKSFRVVSNNNLLQGAGFIKNVTQGHQHRPTSTVADRHRLTTFQWYF